MTAAMIRGLRFALRSNRRNKLFALTAAIAFSFGIGATATVFSAVDAVLLRPATFADAGSMVVVEAAHKNEEWDNVSPAIYSAIRARANLFARVAGERTAIFTVTRVQAPDQVFGLSVSGNFFSLLAAHPLLGRLLTAEDDRAGAMPVVLLSYRAWRKLFGGDPKVVGRSAVIDGEVHTVIGVMPDHFVLPDPNAGSLLWTTLRLTNAELTSPEARGVRLFARRRASAPLSVVQRQLNALAAAEQPDSRGPLRLRVSALRDETDPTRKLTLWLAMGMVCGLLLIGCANLASLLLARAIGRRRDYAIRVATGASRRQLIGETLLEILVVSMAAFPVACGSAYVALEFIRTHFTSPGAGIPNLARVQLDRDTLVFSFALMLLCALGCGLLPAISATSIDLGASLRETGMQIAGGRSARRFLHALLAFETCISLLLLLTSGLLMRSLMRMLSDDHGLRPAHVLTLRLPTGAWLAAPGERSAPPEQQRRVARYLELLRQAERVRGVEAAALASSLPLSHTVVRTRLLAPDGSTIMPIGVAVTSDYFRVLGMPVLSGRTFDRDGALPVALVNEAFVRQYFRGLNPVGQFLATPGSTERTQVIGVVKDAPHLDLTEPIEAEIYRDFEQTEVTPFLTGMVVRSQGEPQALGRDLRKALAKQNADQAVVQVKTLETLIDENIWQPRFSAWLFSAFAGIALCLCAIGIYGVVNYVAASRRRDFGIRAALGAGGFDLLRLALAQSLTPVLLGACGGLLGFYWTSAWVGSLLYKVSPFDAMNGLVCTGIFALIALIAVAGPTLRAMRVDPAITLRHE